MSSEADSYQLVRCLRAGELSETYEATHPGRPGRFLVEVMVPSPEHAEAFERELATLAEADHPNILEVIGLGQLPDGRTAAIWELPGGTLTQWLHSGGSISMEATLGLVAGIAHGLDAAHERGVAHEGVGPDNVFLVDGADLGVGGVKLGGFGLRWFSPTGPRAGSGKTTGMELDLAGLADIAERLLEPLGLLSGQPAPSEEGQPPATLIARARGAVPGAPFETAVMFSEALAHATRAQAANTSRPGPEAFFGEQNSEVDSTGRLGRVVARVGVATLATVATVLLVGTLVDRNRAPNVPEIPKARPSAMASTRSMLHAARPAPPPSPTAPAPLPPAVAPPSASLSSAPHTSALPITATRSAPPPRMPSITPQAAPRTVTVRPPRPSPPRAARGLVWSNRLQRLVKVGELDGNP